MGLQYHGPQREARDRHDEGVSVHGTRRTRSRGLWTAVTVVLSSILAVSAGTVDYLPSDALLTNPERGFYKHTARYSGGTAPLEVSELLDYRSQGFSLVLRLFYLEDFVGAPIGAQYLALIESDFDAIRQAGLKAVVRFAYTETLPPSPPWGDATKSRVLAHLGQLEPLLRANADVIATVQAGFIGVWGEWYYTDHFVADPSAPDQITPQDWADRRDVLSRLLEALPASRMAQLRTPSYKMQIFETVTPLSDETAHDASHVARTGHHNDCFLASDTDYGTYIDDRQTEYPYLSSDTTYTPMGGESCAPNPPRSECATALEELELFHWSYVNADYHPDVLDGWVSGQCLDEILRRIGYRLTLLQGAYSDTVRPGDEIHVQIALDNIGWAAPYNPRLVQLLLRHVSSGQLRAVILPQDPRFWLASSSGGHELSAAVCVPQDMPAGAYELLLNLPDPVPRLRGRAEYSVQVANDGGVREPATGYNRLQHQLIVSSVAPSAPCATHLSFKPWSAPPGEVTGFAWNTALQATWAAEAAAARYHVYRTELEALPGQIFACRDDIDTDLTDRMLIDPETPAPGTGFTYLVTSENPAGDEGTLGHATTGERPNPASCLAP
jgi:hypothetical protein